MTLRDLMGELSPPSGINTIPPVKYPTLRIDHQNLFSAGTINAHTQTLGLTQTPQPPPFIFEQPPPPCQQHPDGQQQQPAYQQPDVQQQYIIQPDQQQQYIQVEQQQLGGPLSDLLNWDHETQYHQQPPLREPLDLHLPTCEEFMDVDDEYYKKARTFFHQNENSIVFFFIGTAVLLKFHSTISFSIYGISFKNSIVFLEFHSLHEPCLSHLDEFTFCGARVRAKTRQVLSTILLTTWLLKDMDP